MSKIGKLPIKIENGVEIKIEDRIASVNGPKGNLKLNLPRGINVEVKEGFIIVSSKDESKEGKSKFGTIRAHLNNMVKGVTAGWSKKLELVGTGYRAETTGKELTLTVGFSHPVKVLAKEGITFKVEKLVVTIDGADKEVVGQTAAEIRSIKPPEPYKGKGIKYVDEIIRRKAGKAAKTVGAA
jgi:large subunit ribosomal protein L6